MSQPDDRDDQDEASNAVLAEYLLRIDRGETVCREEFIASHSECAQSLGEFFADADVVQAMVGAGLLGTRVRGTADAPEVRSGDSSAGPLAPGHRVAGRYEIRRLLGQGGMATVYLADDSVLARIVALKTLPAAALATEEAVSRLLEEARAAASLNHRGIVVVYDAGCDSDGSPFIAMEYIEGCPLNKAMSAQPPDFARAAEIMAEVAEAMAYAHRLGFVHRDLKPANILLDGQGRPHVADFGLALHESRQRERSGELAGTLFYLAPEQARGESHRLDGRADIWAMGVVLYELLTRRRPFGGNTLDQVRDEILHRDPKPPRQIDEAVPAELERICLKCLAKAAKDRYAAAVDVARDLRAWANPPVRRKALWWAVGILAGVLAALAGRNVLRGPSGGRADTPKEAPAEPLKVERFDIQVWNDGAPGRRGLSVAHDRDAVPLRLGDKIRVVAQLNRPAYVYLVWIDSEGQAQPVYPWREGKWDSRPPQEQTLGSLALPPEVDRGWRVGGPAGMETLLLLASEEPLPPVAHLGALLGGLPPQPMIRPQAAVWFVDGRPERADESGTRSLHLADAEGIDDALLRTQRLIQERLEGRFTVIRAVSVANSGK